MLKKIVLLSSAIFPLSLMAGGGATGGATEFTQRLNNSELVVEAENTANTVTEVRKQVDEARKMVEDSKRNLTQLPPEFRWISDLATTASEGYRIYNSLGRIKDSVSSIDDFLHNKAKQLKCENKRIDRCLRDWSNNVQSLKAGRSDDVRYIQTSIERGEENLNKLEEMAKRGQDGGGGNVEQLQILQQQIAALGTHLHLMHVALEDQKMADHIKRTQQEDEKQSDAINTILRHKSKIDNINKLRTEAGIEPIDTSKDDVYNTDIDKEYESYISE
jgi:conjugal transfer/entry exclusion protein